MLIVRMQELAYQKVIQEKMFISVLLIGDLITLLQCFMIQLFLNRELLLLGINLKQVDQVQMDLIMGQNIQVLKPYLLLNLTHQIFTIIAHTEHMLQVLLRAAELV